MRKILAVLGVCMLMVASSVFVFMNPFGGAQDLEQSTYGQYGQTYPIVGTNQTRFYNNFGEITAPSEGQAFYGQDATYPGNTLSYADNGDGTVTDLVTGLMWQKSPDTNGDGVIDYDDKMYYDDALAGAASFNLAGYDDWRLPTIKELYSLIMFFGAEPNPTATSQGSAVPFIDTNYFDFGYGDLGAGERIIDAQYASSTIYVGTTMGGDDTMFGVNFADGRIKGYPSSQTIGKKYYVQYVRDNTAYGTNQFVDNGDGTITDSATCLMWMKNDNGAGVLWENALNYAENLVYAGYSDWRLPDAKELQSIVDYTRSPATNNSAAIDPMFNCTQITNEAGETDYPFYWSSTTFSSMSPTNGRDAAYLSFGRAMGYMAEFCSWIDVHGAGAQRSDPKTGNPADYPYGHGPQGDAIRIYNYVRLVRDVDIDDPVADAGVDQVVSAGSVVIFDGSGSADNIGIVNYSWNFTYNGTAFTLYGIAPEFTFWVEGVYNVTLEVTDAAGNNVTDVVQVTISGFIPEFTILLMPVAGTLALLAAFSLGRRRRRD